METTPTQFTYDGGETVYDGREYGIPPFRWGDGYVAPFFPEDEAFAILGKLWMEDHITNVIYNSDDGSIKFVYNQKFYPEYTSETCLPFIIDGEVYYNIGAGMYVWEIYNPDDGGMKMPEYFDQ